MTDGRRPKRGEAVVVGAGIAGLLAARVLARHFGRVTVLERDALTPEPTPRKGVPQGRHLHSLATRGSGLLEELFPGLDAELAAAGCPRIDQALDTVTALPTGLLPRFRSGVTMRSVSRPLLEWTIRRRLLREGRVRFVEGREVTGLLVEDGRVRGVEARVRGGGGRERFPAEVVLDASGQGSRAPRWLAALGYEPPAETVVDARLGYATRWYRVPEGFSGDWRSLAVLPGWPRNPRGGSLREVEGGRWTVVLLGIAGDYPPTDPEGFERFARSLPSPILHRAIAEAEPISPVYGYRKTANRRRHYERARLPEGFLVAGDAFCTLNPSYGTGMTAAALAARALGEALESGGTRRLGRRFHRSQARAVAAAWRISASSDAQWAAASNIKELGPARRLLHRVSEEVLRLATEDERTARALLEVKNLLAPPQALLRPGILLPALRRSLG
ncbi:Putative epoxidase LasC [Rubrobacter xylanophilus DSM 9941]|nr:Putative epoxidase LasC [Rubrobacter xylanophilus DSM 9941]